MFQRQIISLKSIRRKQFVCCLFVFFLFTPANSLQVAWVKKKNVHSYKKCEMPCHSQGLLAVLIFGSSLAICRHAPNAKSGLHEDKSDCLVLFRECLFPAPYIGSIKDGVKWESYNRTVKGGVQFRQFIVHFLQDHISCPGEIIMFFGSL